MKPRYTLLFFTLVLWFLVAAPHALAQDKSKAAQDNFKLKPGAKGKICLTCHVAFQDKLKSGFVHTPVRTGECSGCHNPHASSHQKMLMADASKLCSRCHAVVPAKASSVHRVVNEGKCTACHDPHASDNKFSLLKRGNQLCYGCHNKIEASSKAKFKHAPVEKDCLNCHKAHASQNAKHLLTDSVPGLCVKCHKTNSPLFVKQHVNYPVASAACTTCHNAHGSGKGGILYDNVHKPVASKMCNQCHDEPTSATPFKVKKEGNELCRGCHSNMMNEMLLKNRLHWPVFSKKGCLSCHNPHASQEGGLRKEPLKELCGSCHKDSVERMDQALKKHAPVNDGNCTACHQPHASNSTFLLNQPVIDLCQTCHDWQKHNSHPMGEKARDRRNTNLAVNCMSCHSAHGTDYKSMLLHATVAEMCTQCHVEYRR